MNPQDPNAPQSPQNYNYPEVPSQQSGFATPGQPQVSPQGAMPQQPQMVASPPPKRGGLKKILLALLIVLVVAGIAAGVYFLTKSDKPATNAPTVSSKGDVQQLTVGVVGLTVALYPKSASDSYSQALSQQIYEGLVAYEDQTKIVPRLSTGWSNPDSSTWDFNLRQDVAFHNGHKLKANDVVASLERAKQNPDLSIYNDTLSDIKALGDYKVEIKTSKPDPFLLNKLTYLMILDSKDIDAADGSNATGPYELKTELTDTEADLTAFDKYYGGHIYVKNLTFLAEPDEATAAKDFAAGKVNMAGDFNSKDPTELKGLKAQKIIADDPAVTFVTLNTVQTGPLQNLKVRQALRESLDIPTLISASNISAEPASQLVTKAIPGYDPSLSVPKQDITKAKQLLTEAGYPNGVTLTLDVGSQNLQVAQEVAKQAKAAGITINVNSNDNFDDLIDKLMAGKTQMALLSYSSDLQDGSEVFDTVLRQTGNYKSADLDNLLEQASTTLNQEKRLKDLQQASKSLDENVAAIPLFNRQRPWFTDKSYAIQFDNVAADPGINFWKVYLTN